MPKKRHAPPVTTGYDPRAVERAPEYTDGHLPQTDDLRSPADANSAASGQNSPPKAPDGISGDWQ